MCPSRVVLDFQDSGRGFDKREGENSGGGGWDPVGAMGKFDEEFNFNRKVTYSSTYRGTYQLVRITGSAVRTREPNTIHSVMFSGAESELDT